GGFVGGGVGSGRLETLLGDLRAELARRADSSRTQTEALADAEAALTQLRATVPASTGRFPWTPGASALGRAVNALREALEELHGALGSAHADEPLLPLAEPAGNVRPYR